MDSTLRTALRRWLVALDTAAIVLAMLLAMGLHAYLRRHLEGFKAPPALESYLLLALLTLPLWLAIARQLGLYEQLARALDLPQLVRDLLRLHVYGLLGLTLLIYLTQVYMNRSVVALFLVLTFSLMLAARLLVHWAIRLEQSRGHARHRVLLAADRPDSIREMLVAVRLQTPPPLVVGCMCSTRVPFAGEIDGLQCLGTIDRMREVLKSNAVDEVLVSWRPTSPVEIDLALQACDEVGVRLRLVMQLDETTTRPSRIDDGFGLPSVVFDAGRPPADALIVKRLVDIVVSGAALLALSPLLLGIAAGIVMTMGRPVLLRQKRTGRNGRVFEILKFRTMVQNADALKQDLLALNEVDGPTFKIDMDPRVTPFGRFLRRSSLDELPQLWNVFGGSMSLVGPRPLVVAEQDCISGPQRRRLSMKPGMTGLWQVSGRSDVSFDEWMRLDLQYVDNWSLQLDFKLLARTIPAVLTARGAR